MTPSAKHNRLTCPTVSAKLVRALEHGVVIELGILGQSQLLPALAQAAESYFGSDLELRPRIDLPAQERGGGEHLDKWAIGNLEVLDPVKAIDLSSPRHHLGQVPAARGRRAAQPAGAIECATASQHAVNGGRRGRWRGLRLKRERDGPCSILAQDAFLAQLAPSRQNAALHFGRRAVPGASRLAIREQYPLQRLTARMRDPTANRSHRYMTLPCYRVHRTTLSNQFNHVEPFSLDAFFYSCSAPKKHQGYPQVFHER